MEDQPGQGSARILLGPLDQAARAIQPFLKCLETARQTAIQELIACARQSQASRAHRIFQELILGSREYQRTYGLPPEFEVESYLLIHDTSHLDAQIHKDWPAG